MDVNSTHFSDLILHCIKAARHLKERLNVMDKFLEVEISTLNVFVYKNNNRFRNDKGFKDVRMAQKSWQKFQDLQLFKASQVFLESLPIPHDVTSGKKRSKLYLPTRQMLQFFLVRLRGSFHLLHKLQVLSQNAGDHALMRLNLGHFWNVGLMHLALMSRLW